MNIEEARAFCLGKNAVTEDMPFGEGTVVFRIGGKIFAILSIDSTPCRLNLKCNPSKVEELREENTFIIPGFHMNKKHWNSIIVEEITNLKLVIFLINHSYDLVLNSLSKKIRKEILNEL